MISKVTNVTLYNCRCSEFIDVVWKVRGWSAMMGGYFTEGCKMGLHHKHLAYVSFVQTCFH